MAPESRESRPRGWHSSLCSWLGHSSAHLDTVCGVRWLSHSLLLLNENLSLWLETPASTLGVLSTLICSPLELAKPDDGSYKSEPQVPVSWTDPSKAAQ